MRRMLAGSALLVAALAGSAAAQAKKTPAPKAAAAAKAVTWEDLTGQWDGKAMRAKDDSSLTLTRMTFTADKKVFLRFPGSTPVAVKVITMGGDSLVTEAGPYDSVTR